MKFSIHLGVPQKSAGQTPWAAGRADLREAFAPLARRYRRRFWWGVGALASFLVATGLLAQTNLGRSLGLAGAVGALGLWLLAAGFSLWRLRLVCPGCHRGLVPTRGKFCPVCGSEAYAFGVHRSGKQEGRVPYCPDCGASMDEGMGDDPRAYRIHGCTHCGAWLDRRGV